MKFLSGLTICICINYTVHAQIVHHKIAIFTSLYVDSAFDASGTVLLNKTIPHQSEPGIEFYMGAQMALDSLQKRNIPLDVYFYDLKSRESLANQLIRPELNDAELIIGQTNFNETKMLAETSYNRKIPFISATLPNDAGINNDPYLVILNSTLQTHIEGIFHFLQKNYNQYRIIVFRKSGFQEDQLKSYIIENAKTSTGLPMNIKFIDIGSNFTLNAITVNLDSTQKTVCIAGSLDGDFGLKLAQSLASVHKSYPVTLIGMPTWENMNLSRGNLNDMEIIYTTPFYYNHSFNFENQLASDYTSKMGARPSDMFFRGYETTLRFALLLYETKRDFASNLSRKGNSVLTEFDIEPVFKDKKNMMLDYFENKHLYFIKVFGGVKNIIY